MTANYKFGGAQSVDLATLRQGPTGCLRVRKKKKPVVFDTETYLSLRLIQGWVVPPNMGISVPISIWISSNVHTTLRANLWFDLGSGRFSSGLGSGNGGQALQKQKKKTIQNHHHHHHHHQHKHKGSDPLIRSASKVTTAQPAFFQSSNCSSSLWSVVAKSSSSSSSSTSTSRIGPFDPFRLQSYNCSTSIFLVFQMFSFLVVCSGKIIIIITIIIIINMNIKDRTLWSVPSPKLQLLSPAFLWSSNCSPSLWSVVVWFQRDSVL